jgi:hypothetical protein
MNNSMDIEQYKFVLPDHRQTNNHCIQTCSSPPLADPQLWIAFPKLLFDRKKCLGYRKLIQKQIENSASTLDTCDIVSHATWSNVNIVSGGPFQLNVFELSCSKHLFSPWLAFSASLIGRIRINTCRNNIKSSPHIRHISFRNHKGCLYTYWIWSYTQLAWCTLPDKWNIRTNEHVLSSQYISQIKWY